MLKDMENDVLMGVVITILRLSYQDRGGQTKLLVIYLNVNSVSFLNPMSTHFLQ